MKRVVICLFVVLVAGLATAGKVEDTPAFKKDYADGTQLIKDRQYSEAQAVWESLPAKYPAMVDENIAVCKRQVACCLMWQKRLPEAQAQLEKVLLETPKRCAFQRMYANMILGDVLVLEGKLPEATKAYMDGLREGAPRMDPIFGFYMWNCLGRMNPSYLSSDEYKQFITDIIKAVPAVESNAKFLGRLKSELEKTK
jgi:predicted Zn-dependent protease